MDGDNIKTIKPEPAAMIVIGNEAKGVSAELIPFIQKRISILHRTPQENNPESLNASIAAAEYVMNPEEMRRIVQNKEVQFLLF